MVRTEYREDTDEDEWNQGQQSPPFTGAPDGDGADRRTEDQLKLREQDLRDRADWVRQDADVEDRRLAEQIRKFPPLAQKTFITALLDNLSLREHHNVLRDSHHLFIVCDNNNSHACFVVLEQALYRMSH